MYELKFAFNKNITPAVHREFHCFKFKIQIKTPSDHIELHN